MIKHGLIEPKSTFSFTVEAENAGQRVDIFLTKQFTHYSRSYFQRLIDNQVVTINDVKTKKQGTVLKQGDTIAVAFPDESIQNSPLTFNNDAAVSCIHKDEHFLVITKSADVVTHKPKSDYAKPTLTDWLTAHFQEIASVGYIDRPGIVHRLDKDTSGLMLIARTNYGHTILSELFKQRTIQKTYIALVHGHPSREGTIDLPIGRHPLYRTKMAIFPKQVTTTNSTITVRHALTHYQVLHYFNDCSLVKVMPVTGRTHQIRVHFSAIGHPLVGDLVYHKGSSHIARQALHAYGLTFSLDTKEYSFTANPPEDFLHALRELGSQSKESPTASIPFIHYQP
jgi:23S rRNA pseudouridine1911/1915/1917 synthase